MKEFQPFRLDVRNQCLWKGHERLALMPKPFAVLTHLVEHAGRLVTQDELLTAVWPDTFVQPEVLRKHILEIRRVLDDRADEPRFVETLPKRGYIFIAPVTDVDTAPPTPRPSTRVEPLAVSLPGRDAELTALHTCLQSVLVGARAIVFATGEAGIGKTTLVDAWLRSIAGDARVTMLRGQAVEGFAGKEPYYPILDALSQIGRRPGATELAEALARYAPTWLARMPTLANGEHRPDRTRDVAGATREGMVREICEALEVWSESRAIVIVLEDLHWADTSTLDVVSALARRRQPARLLLLGTYRPADVIVSESPLKSLKQDLLLHGLCRELALERLGPLDVRAHVRSALGEQPAAFADAIHRQSAGNPLFMTALLAHLVRQGVVEALADGWQLTVDATTLDPGIPDTLKQMLRAQIETLSPIEQRVLAAASIHGTTFSTWAVNAILGSDDAAVADVCAALCDGPQLLRAVERRTSDPIDDREYEFSHALYRELLYRRLATAERIQAHRRLAEALEARMRGQEDTHATALAEHFEKGHVYASAARHAIRAAHLAARRLAHAEAMAIAEHALALLPRIDEGARAALELGLANGLGDAAYALGDAVRSAQAYERAAASAERLGSIDDQAEALFRLAGPTALFDPDGAIRACLRAITLGHTSGEPVIEHRGRLLAACWRTLFHGWTSDDSDACRASIDELRRRGVDPLPAHDLMLLAHVQFIQSEYAAAAESARLGLETLTEREALWDSVAGMTAEAVASMYLGRYGVAHQRLQDGLEIARKNGNRPWEGILQGVLASVHLHTCDFVTAKAIANAILTALGDAPIYQISVNMLFTRGFAELWSGEWREARESFRAALEQGSRAVFPLHWYFRMFARLGLGEAALAEGALEDAARETLMLLKETASCRDITIQALAWDLQARVSLAENNLVAARDAMSHALSTFEPFAVPMAAWRIYDTAGSLESRLGHKSVAAGHRRRSAEMINQIVASLETCPHLRDTLLNDSRVREILNGSRSFETIRLKPDPTSGLG